MKKPSASTVPIAETPETKTILQSQIDATLRIAEARAQKRRHMREAILANDVAVALAAACELAGFSQREVATRVEAMLAVVTRSTHSG